MDDIQAPPAGTKGTVYGVDDTGSLLVHWDNGSGLKRDLRRGHRKEGGRMIDPKDQRRNRDHPRQQALQICSTFLWYSGLPSTGTTTNWCFFIEEHRDEYIRFILHGDAR
jgi:hypothetical protein